MTTPYLSTRSIAKYLDLFHADGQPNIRAALEWVNRNIPPAKVQKFGRLVRVHKDDIDAAGKPRWEAE